MPDMWMDVDTALSEVPVNKVALIDDTDFKTREEAVAYNATGLELIWHFTTTAGATSATVVTPTTGGVYDWAHQDGGLYTIEIPASGGASINNDTEGFGFFSGKADGVLPWVGPTIGFRAAAINNALIDGGDVLDVNLTQIGGVEQSATDLKDFADEGYDPSTNKVQGVVLVDTCTANSDMRGTDSALLASSAPANFGDLAITATTGRVTVGTNNDKTGYSLTNLTVQASTTLVSGSHNPQSGDAYARLGAPAGASVSVDIAAVKSETASILGDTNELQADWEDGGRLDVNLDTVKTAVGVTIPGAISGLNDPTADAIADAVWNETIVGHTTAGTFGAKNQRVVPSETIADYRATGFSTHSATDVWAAGTRTLTAGTNLSFSTFDPSTDEIETGVTYLQGLRAACAALAGILAGANGSTITIKAIGAAADGTTRITATVDADGNRSAVTLNL